MADSFNLPRTPRRGIVEPKHSWAAISLCELEREIEPELNRSRV